MTQMFEPFKKVLVRDNDAQKWRVNFFSHMDNDVKIHRFVCVNYQWTQCIPWEGNEHLLGTTVSPTPPEPKFKFGDKVYVSDDGEDWKKAVFIEVNLSHAFPYQAIVEDERERGEVSWNYCRKADW